MELGLIALPLAFLAGVAGILSPCVWPLIPVVVGSAASGGKWAPWSLAAGLSLSFAIAGSILSFMLVSARIDPELFRYIAAGILVFVGLLLVVPQLAYTLTGPLSALTGRIDTGDSGRWYGHFGVGFLLGIVWLPCVGPTLGAAIGLASMGQQLFLAFAVMLMFGAGTGLVLLGVSLLSRKALSRWSQTLIISAEKARKFLGYMLLLLGFMVFSGFDKTLQVWALEILPHWVVEL